MMVSRFSVRPLAIMPGPDSVRSILAFPGAAYSCSSAKGCADRTLMRMVCVIWLFGLVEFVLDCFRDSEEQFFCVEPGAETFIFEVVDDPSVAQFRVLDVVTDGFAYCVFESAE